MDFTTIMAWFIGCSLFIEQQVLQVLQINWLGIFSEGMCCALLFVLVHFSVQMGVSSGKETWNAIVIIAKIDKIDFKI